MAQLSVRSSAYEVQLEDVITSKQKLERQLGDQLTRDLVHNTPKK